MQKSESSDEPEGTRSRPTSRRNSGPFCRRGSVKKEPEVKKTGTAPNSASSTPKRVQKSQNIDFMVTGKQLLKKSDRANSLPGSYHRRPSTESLIKSKRSLDSPKKITSSPKTRDTSLEDDMSLDLSQVSDFEDTISKYGAKDKIAPLATSTPKKLSQKNRSSSLQSAYQKEPRKEVRLESKRSRDSVTSCSRDSLYKTSSSTSYKHAISTELDYSSMSPEYSGPSSNESVRDTLVSPRSQDLQDSSFCVSTWQDSEPGLEPGLEHGLEGTRGPDPKGLETGEWSHFWANYNNSLARVPLNRYYDQCPTPYRSEDFDLADLEISTESSRIRSPENIKTINNIIRNEGLRLTPRETQNIIKCAHMLGNVLTKAIERQSRDLKRDYSLEKIHELNVQKPDPEKELKKKNLTLDLKETNIPLEVKEEKRCESVPTQTDISLPNTKSAPLIFENILRQLSMSSIDEVPAENLEENKNIETTNNNGAVK